MNEIVLENRKRMAHLRTAAVLSLAAGSVIFASGITSHSIILTALSPGAEGLVVQSAAFMISLFLMLSGAFFVLGGAMLVYRNYYFGRPLVALAGGLSIFTLAFCLFVAFLGSGFSVYSSLANHPEYLAGIILATGSTVIELQTKQTW